MRNYIHIPEDLVPALREVFREVSPFRRDPGVEDQAQVIYRAARKFRAPNLFDVIGWPDESQYDAKGNLKPERLADLLVVGAFRWKGLWIAKYPRPIPRRYGPPWAREIPDPGVGWVVLEEWDPASVDPPGIGDWRIYETSPLEEPPGLDARPFEGCNLRPLAELIYDKKRPGERGDRRVGFKNGNPYDARPPNLIVQRPGRTKHCAKCGYPIDAAEHYTTRKTRGQRDHFCEGCRKRAWVREG